jgi:hypothetical protein
MTRAIGLAIAGFAALALSPTPPAAAQDASFGCKALLCAAAAAPGWSGIPYCVPVMQQLFRELAHGEGWPSCPEGHASGLGYDPYLACPAGFTAVQSEASGANRGGGAGGLQASPDGDLCADLSRPSQSCSGRGACDVTYPTTSRPRRADPYFVDITTANGAQRFYFSLQGL